MDIGRLYGATRKSRGTKERRVRQDEERKGGRKERSPKGLGLKGNGGERGWAWKNENQKGNSPADGGTRKADNEVTP